MFWIGSALFLVLVSVVWFVVAPSATEPTTKRNLHGDKLLTPGRKSLKPLGGIGIALAAILIAMGSFTTVQAKNVGVLLTFGKPSERTLDSGLHAKLPWQKVTEIDGTIQTNEYKGDDALYVRIGDGSQSKVSLTIRWRINQDKANIVFADFRSDNPADTFRKAVVSTQLKAATQEAMAEYNPIADLEVVEGSNAKSASQLSFAPDFDAVATAITESMEDRLEKSGGLATLDSVTVSYVSLSKSTQATVDSFIAEVGKTRIASQRRSTATEEAAANKALAESVTDNPGVLQSKCLDKLSDAIEAGYSLPAGFNCLGGGSAVVVPSARP